MSFQPEQLIALAVYSALGFLAYYSKPKGKAILLIVGILFFAVNPFRMTATPIQRTTNNNQFNTLPERVIVKKESFEEFNNSKAANLNQQNERTHNEIQH